MSSFVIKHYPDEQLQQRINGYYAAFAAQDVERLMEFIGDEFHMDDYEKSARRSVRMLTSPSRLLAAGMVGMNREDFKAFNEKMFGGGIADVQIDCISLQGSSSPSTVTALEWAMHLKLNVEIPQLAPGVGAGEKVTLVGTSLLWWNEEGKVCRQSEHGRVAWPNIDIEKMRKPYLHYKFAILPPRQ
ncbi:MAG: hypothetical protein M1815_002065 [Lichina confinis]|nr:MAG: hypothetical protein M1815_002065 [Lichina confinis]